MALTHVQTLAAAGVFVTAVFTSAFAQSASRIKHHQPAMTADEMETYPASGGAGSGDSGSASSKSDFRSGRYGQSILDSEVEKRTINPYLPDPKDFPGTGVNSTD